MKTYNDLLEVVNNQAQLYEFMQSAINDHKSTEMYRNAIDANLYYRWKNPTIMMYKKLLTTLTGRVVPDEYSANHKCAGNFYDRFTTQEVQYLLGNGVTFNDEATKDRLGKMVDSKLKELTRCARIGGVSFGFYNLDHIEVFEITEFVPLYDEEDGALKAGIRFWQIDGNKPLRTTLYELDGYTDFIKRKGEDFEILHEKRAYIQTVKTSEVDGTQIFDLANYPGFPIVPMWGSEKHQSSIVGLRENIDCYDLIKSGFANDLDDANLIYWTISNAGGMDEVDLAKFLDHMKRVRAALLEEDGAQAEAHTLDIPYQSREVYLERLERDMYRDAMAVNTDSISAGNVTATAIIAAYQALDDKCDGIEYCVTEFIQGILALIGIEDEPTYKRNRIANQTEETNMVLAAAEYLDNETVLKHLPFLNPDEIDSILDKTTEEEAERYKEMEQELEDLKAQQKVTNPDVEPEAIARE